MTAITAKIKRDICALFEVHDDEGGVQRVVTPLELPGTGDQVVVRVRPRNGFFQVDENGDTAFSAAMNGGNLESETVGRWLAFMAETSPVVFNDEELITAEAKNESELAATILKVASFAQHFYGVAVNRQERKVNDFRDRLAEVVQEVAAALKLGVQINYTLPQTSGLTADFLIGEEKNPLIIIAAHNQTRLLEAEVIWLQYQRERVAGYVLAVAESQMAVTKQQFERAPYFTDKAVIFEPSNFGPMMKTIASNQLQ